MMQRLWDPVNRVWCKVVPAGYTFAEWHDQEDRFLKEVVLRSPVMVDAIAQQALARLRLNTAQS